ncbi:MAG: CPBP family intramembrane metalloprotease [Gemmataceae bacterium]|nr:CPBP family intramembrane metalloprotease [Gemmataceae bacterium]
MNPDVWTDALRLGGCFLAVTAAALPAGLLAWAVARRHREAWLPPPRPWRAPWGGLAVVGAFLLLGPYLAPPIGAEVLSRAGVFTRLYGEDLPASPGEDDPDRAAAAVVRGLWGGLAAFPVQLGVVAAAAVVLHVGSHRACSPSVAARVRLAVFAGLGLMLLVHAVHTTVNLLFAELNWAPGQHPLTRMGNRPALDQTLFAFEACVRAPVVEELCFRGILLPWVLGSRDRVWFTLAAAVGLGVLFGLARASAGHDPTLVVGPGLFAGGLAAGWLAVGPAFRRKRRSAGAVYASAALFAAVHSAVWPSPVPLFLLGLGLGWLALRTGGILAPVIVHGLFNAVSVLYVLT